MEPGIRHLHFFEILAKHGNVGSAARELAISQPALSRSLQVLERSLDTTLFDRSRRGITLTPDGTFLLERVELLLRQYEALVEDFRQHRQLERGEVKLAFGVYPADLSCNQTVAAINLLHPGLTFQLRVADWQVVARLVSERRVHAGVAEISLVEEQPELQAMLVGSHQMFFYGRREHPIFDEDLSDTDRLFSYPLAAIRAPIRVASYFPSSSAAGKVHQDKQEFVPAIQIESLTASKQIVLHSNALGIAPPSALEAELERGDLRILPQALPWLRLNYGVISIAGRSLSPAVEAFQEQLERTEQEVMLKNESLMARFASGG